GDVPGDFPRGATFLGWAVAALIVGDGVQDAFGGLEFLGDGLRGEVAKCGSCFRSQSGLAGCGHGSSSDRMDGCKFLGNWQPLAGCRDNSAVVILAPRAGFATGKAATERQRRTFPAPKATDSALPLRGTLMVKTTPLKPTELEWGTAAHSSKTNCAVTGCWLRAEHRLLHRHGRKPVVAIGHGSMDDPEELLLDRTCDRSESAFANANLVHRADRSDLRRGAGKKDLVGQVKHFAGDHLLDDRDIQVARDLDNGIARDSRQNRVAQGGGHEHALADDKQVLARALADVAVGVKRNAFGVAVEDGLHLDELRVHVVCGALGHGGQGVGGNTRPGGDAYVHTLF